MQPVEGVETSYVIYSVPSAMQVQYWKTPNPTPKILIPETTAWLAPTALALNKASGQLFVSDPPNACIWWFQLIQLPDGTLITDGVKHTLFAPLTVSPTGGMSVDPGGNVWFGGTAIMPPAWLMTNSIDVAIHKKVTPEIILANTGMFNKRGEFHRGNTGGKVWDPGPMTAEGGTILTGNKAGGTDHGTVVKLPGAQVLADGTAGDSLKGILESARFIFFATEKGIWGISRGKGDASCAHDACMLISDKIKNAKGMKWDGDGTMYIADGSGKIYTLPTGNMEPHNAIELFDTGAKIEDMVLLQIQKDGGKSGAINGGIRFVTICLVITLFQSI